MAEEDVAANRRLGKFGADLIKDGDTILTHCNAGALATDLGHYLADEPDIGSGGDSSYAAVAFHERLSCGGDTESRVLMNRLRASAYDGVKAPDGLSGTTAESATSPQITMGEYGHGWITSSRSSANDLIATALGDDGITQGSTKVNGSSFANPTSSGSTLTWASLPSVPAGGTVLFGTSSALGLSVSGTLGAGAISKGSARVLATKGSGIICSAFLADPGNAPPTSMTYLTVVKKTKQKGE